MLGARRLPRWRLVAVLATVGLISAAAGAQIIQPVIAEYAKEAHGQFEITNTDLRPVNVVLELRSFRVAEDGEVSYGPLPDGLQLRLSAMSARVAPQQSYTFFYDVKAEKLPAWFVVFACIRRLPVQDTTSLDIQLELPHYVYLLPKPRLQKEDVRIAESSFEPGDKKVRLVVENRGPSFGRVFSVRVSGPHSNAEAPGFPLFPHSRRRIEVPWSSPSPPQRVAVRFSDFLLEEEANEAFRQAKSAVDVAPRP